VTNSFGAASGIVSDITSGAIRQGVGVLVKERSRISWAGVASGAIQNTAIAGFTGAFSSQTSSNAAQQVTDRVKRTQGQFTGGQAPRYGDAGFHTNTHQRSGVTSDSLRPQVSQTLANGARSFPLANQPRYVGEDIVDGAGLFSGFNGFELSADDVFGYQFNIDQSYSAEFELYQALNSFGEEGPEFDLYLAQPESTINQDWQPRKHRIAPGINSRNDSTSRILDGATGIFSIGLGLSLGPIGAPLVVLGFNDLYKAYAETDANGKRMSGFEKVGKTYDEYFSDNGSTVGSRVGEVTDFISGVVGVGGLFKGVGSLGMAATQISPLTLKQRVEVFEAGFDVFGGVNSAQGLPDGLEQLRNSRNAELARRNELESLPEFSQKDLDLLYEHNRDMYYKLIGAMDELDGNNVTITGKK
jgi:hypothetical protein